ncbi:hypothetical protein [Methanospirillum sp.]
MILNIILAVIVLSVTILCGLPFLWKTRLRGITQLSLSFAVGFVFILLLGILASFCTLNPLLFQVPGIIICIGTSIVLYQRHGWNSEFDRDDTIILGVVGLYLLIGIFFFYRIIMWMSGDAVAHAEMIRMLIDGENLPIGLPGIHQYAEYYPKGFHYYAYVWASIFPLLKVIQVLPVIITSITPVLLYSIVREFRKHDAVYTCVIACFMFPAHYSYLIWGGYPSASAEMLFVAMILALIVQIRLVPIILLGIFFAHARIMALAIPVLITGMYAMKMKKNIQYIHKLVLSGLFVCILAIFLFYNKPEYLLSVFSDKTLASDFISRWYPALLALLGAAIAVTRNDRLDRLTLTWTGVVFFIVLLADAGPLRFIGTADRLLLLIYLPLSILAATAIGCMARDTIQVRNIVIVLLTVVGVVSMGVVLYSYAGSWALPQEDYAAMMWLSEQNFNDTVCINLDETGAWIYPLTGIEVAKSRTNIGFSYGLPKKIAANPINKNLITELKKIKHENVLFFISNVSLSRPGYIPPFSIHHKPYPTVNMNFSEKNYEMLYDEGTKIFKFIV